MDNNQQLALVQLEQALDSDSDESQIEVSRLACNVIDLFSVEIINSLLRIYGTTRNHRPTRILSLELVGDRYHGVIRIKRIDDHHDRSFVIHGNEFTISDEIIEEKQVALDIYGDGNANINNYGSRGIESV